MSTNPLHGMSRSELELLHREGMLPMLKALAEAESAASNASGGGVAAFFCGLIGLAVFGGLAYGAFQLLFA